VLVLVILVGAGDGMVKSKGVERMGWCDAARAMEREHKNALRHGVGVGSWFFLKKASARAIL